MNEEMPNVRETWDSKLIDQFLSVYDSGSWAVGLSDRDKVESRIDGAVELLATRKRDGRTLAIEHTLVEPFVGERDDYHKHFKFLQQKLRADDSLRVPGFTLYLDMPVGALPRKSNWQGITDDVIRWLRAEHVTFPADKTLRRCPCPHHPSGELMVQIAKVPLGDAVRSFPVIVHRYGEMRLGESVEKALRGKLPKLVQMAADRRLLLLERDQGWVDMAEIHAEIDRRRPEFVELADVNEVWIADTASWEDTGRWVAFSRSAADGSNIETFEFYDGELWAQFKYGMPVLVRRGPGG
jgi:hypothetical protein